MVKKKRMYNDFKQLLFMEAKTITLPNGWRVKEVIGDRIILSK